jgi:hypothetical protein
MSNNLPAKLPVRQTKEVTRQSKATAAPANPPAALTKFSKFSHPFPGSCLSDGSSHSSSASRRD